jgi:hypothetical protein
LWVHFCRRWWRMHPSSLNGDPPSPRASSFCTPTQHSSSARPHSGHRRYPPSQLAQSAIAAATAVAMLHCHCHCHRQCRRQCQNTATATTLPPPATAIKMLLPPQTPNCCHSHHAAATTATNTANAKLPPLPPRCRHPSLQPCCRCHHPPICHCHHTIVLPPLLPPLRCCYRAAAKLLPPLPLRCQAPTALLLPPLQPN